MNFSKYEKEIAQLRADLAATQAELERREKQLRKETDEKLLLQAKHIEQLLQSRFALKVVLTRISYDILNWDGDFKVARTYEGLRTGEGLQMLFFTHRAVTSTPNAKFGHAQVIDEKTSPGITMNVWEEGNTRFFKINFPQQLTSSEFGANYAFEYTMEKGVLMTKEAATEAYRNDPRPREALYQVNEISTGSLQLDVTFPLKYPAKCNCLALINDIVHADETKRLIIETKDRGVSLRVEKPLPGFQYLVEWDGPSERDSERLKAEPLGKESASNRLDG